MAIYGKTYFMCLAHCFLSSTKTKPTEPSTTRSNSLGLLLTLILIMTMSTWIWFIIVVPVILSCLFPLGRYTRVTSTFQLDHFRLFWASHGTKQLRRSCFSFALSWENEEELVLKPFNPDIHLSGSLSCNHKFVYTWKIKRTLKSKTVNCHKTGFTFPQLPVVHFKTVEMI